MYLNNSSVLVKLVAHDAFFSGEKFNINLLRFFVSKNRKNFPSLTVLSFQNLSQEVCLKH